MGVSATEPDTLAGDLSTEVTNAVIADFLINGVFAEAGKNITNPDAVMTGENHTVLRSSWDQRRGGDHTPY